MNTSSRRRGALSAVFAVLGLFFFTHGVYFHFQHAASIRYLETEIAPHIDDSTEEILLKQALYAAFDIPPHRDPKTLPNYGLKHPLLKALGPPASLIHQEGGHCGRRSRLLMAILELYDVPSRKVHLINARYAEFNHNHHYVHAVVEVKINGMWVIADPLYNLIYSMPDDTTASLEDIQRQTENVFMATINQADTRYSPYFEELYTFDEYRKFIWNSFPGGEAIYMWLSGIIGKDRAADIPGPVIIEKPLLAISVTSYLGAALFLILSILSSRSRNRFQHN